jgi:hypothetical protein
MSGRWTNTGAVYNHYLSQMMLNIGTSAAPFKRAGGTIGAELQLCQRYYEKSFAVDTTPVTNIGSGTGEQLVTVANAGGYGNSANFFYKVTKRSSVSPILYNHGNASNDASWYNSSDAVVRGGAVSSYSSAGFNILINGDTTRVKALGHWACDTEL